MQIQSVKSFLVALAGFVFEQMSIQDGQTPTTVFDYAVSLQSASRIRHGFAPHAEKARHHFMSDLDDARGRSVLYREYPPAHSLFEAMTTIAGDRLRH